MITQYDRNTMEFSKLPTQEEFLQALSEKGFTRNGLECVLEDMSGVVGFDRIWHYPISDSVSAGGVIIPVREGFIWIPYDDMSKAEGEIYNPIGVRVLNVEELMCLADEFKDYADRLHAFLHESARLLNETVLI